MIRASRLLFALFALSVSSGCTGTETGNPGTASLTITVTTSDSSIASTTDGTGHVVKHFEILLESTTLLDCAGHDVGSVTFPFAQEVVDDSERAHMPAGDFCGVRLAFAPGGGASALRVTGTRSDGVPFTIDDRHRLALTLSSGEPFTIHDGDSLFVTFDVAEWLGGTFLDDAVAAGNQIVVDSTTNASGIDAFESQGTAALYRDANTDDHIDPTDGASLAAGHSLHAP